MSITSFPASAEQQRHVLPERSELAAREGDPPHRSEEALRALARLRRQVAGTIRFASPSAGRTVHQLPAYDVATDHKPWVVIEPTGTTDLCAAVKAASALGRPVEVVGSGHASVAVRPGSVVLSTGKLRAVWVDPDRRRVRVQPGTRWSDVIHEAATFGLAPLSGSSADVGVTGYLLGGGFGLFSREFGFASDHLHEAEVVDRHGVPRRVNEGTEGDLFWALRGSGHAFGVVSSLDFGLIPMPAFVGGGLFYPASAAPSVLAAWQAWTPTLPPNASTSIALARLPYSASAPLGLAGHRVIHVRFALRGEGAEADHLLRAIRGAGPVLADNVEQRDYAESGKVHLDPPGPLNLHDDSLLLRYLPREALDTFLEHAGPDSGSILRLAELRHLGGRMSAQRADSSVSFRDAAFHLYASAAHAAEDGAPIPPEARRDVARLMRAMQPWSAGGRALNFLGDTTPQRLLSAYEPAVLKRLREVKARHDPSDLFVSARSVLPHFPATRPQLSDPSNTGATR